MRCCVGRLKAGLCRCWFALHPGTDAGKRWAAESRAVSMLGPSKVMIMACFDAICLIVRPELA